MSDSWKHNASVLISIIMLWYHLKIFRRVIAEKAMGQYHCLFKRYDVKDQSRLLHYHQTDSLFLCIAATNHFFYASSASLFDARLFLRGQLVNKIHYVSYVRHIVADQGQQPHSYSSRPSEQPVGSTYP
jgi:hypothetical protein